MDVLNDQRKESLSAIALSGLADGAAGRIGPEALVVGSPIVVAREPKSGWERKYQESWRERNESGKPRRPPAVNPGMRIIGEEQRRVERREVVAEGKVLVLDRRPGRIHEEAGEDDENDERLHPPGVPAHRLTEA